MSNEYTPITETVRTRYIQHGNQGVAINGAEFDRWLAAHDAEVAAKAWDDGCIQGYNTQTTLNSTMENNPHDTKEEA